MGTTNKNYGAEFKAKVAIEAIKCEKTQNEITSEYGIHSTQIKNWKKQALDAVKSSFSKHKVRLEKQQKTLIDDLYKQIGKLIVERDWLKKKSGIAD